MTTVDPYKVLGIPHSATAAEIKAAYHAKARLYHPDKQTPSAAEKDDGLFQQIQQAWECLSDDERKMEYQKNRQMQQSRNAYRYSSAIPLQQEDCYEESAEETDDPHLDRALLYNCRCGAVLEVTPLDDDDAYDKEEEHPAHIVECPDCSLLYNTLALSSS